jgi:uncharacterized protein (DUF58 family)
MIPIPTNRAILLAGVILLPAAATAAYAPEWMLAAVAAALLLAIVFIVDELLASMFVGEIRISVPEVSRLTRGIESGIEMTIEQSAARGKLLKLGLALDSTIQSAQDTLLVRMPEDIAKAVVEWPCTPSERGNFHLQLAYAATASPLGLWEHRMAVPIDGAVRVYPNVQAERRNLAALFLSRDPLGLQARRFIGKGREFEQLRDYLPGDSFEDIHWKATARRGVPVTKTYQVERTQEVYVLIDSSRLSATTLKAESDALPMTNLERYINAALVLGLVAERQGDLFGLVTFDERVHRFIKARNGRAHYNACRDAIYAVEPSEQNPDFAELFSYVRLNLRKRALLIVLTNLSDPLLAESFTENVDLISRNHLVLVNMIADPEVQPVFSDQPVETVDEIYARIGGHLEWQNLQSTRQQLHLRNVDMRFVSRDALTAQLVSQYVSSKQRQLI